MGLNEQADAVTLDTGHDGSEDFSAGQDDDSTEGGDDDEDSRTSIDDIVDAESYEEAASEMAEAEMPDLDASDDDDDKDADNSEVEDANKDDGDASDQQDDDADSQAQADDKQGDDADKGDDDKGGDTGDDDADKSGSKRFRVRSDNPVTARMFELLGRNQDMDPEDALAKAKAELGSNDDTTDSKDDADGDQGSELPSSVKETEAKIDDLRKQRKTAMRDDLDFERADELDDQIYKLTTHVGDLKLSGVQTESADQQVYLQDLEVSKDQAVDLYPFVTNKDGAEIERMEEIDSQLEANGDPLFTSADKPLRIAQMVAREFGIAPKGKVIKQPAVQAGGKPPRQKSPVQPASASARTAPIDQNGQAEQRLDNVNSILDYEELMEEQGY